MIWCRRAHSGHAGPIYYARPANKVSSAPRSDGGPRVANLELVGEGGPEVRLWFECSMVEIDEAVRTFDGFALAFVGWFVVCLMKGCVWIISKIFLV